MPAEPEPLADELIRAVELLAEVFAAKAVRNALVGGLATLLRGRPRFTQDVDILLDVPQLALPGLLDELARRGFTFDAATVIQEYVRAPASLPACLDFREEEGGRIGAGVIP